MNDDVFANLISQAVSAIIFYASSKIAEIRWNTVHRLLWSISLSFIINSIVNLSVGWVSIGNAWLKLMILLISIFTVTTVVAAGARLNGKALGLGNGFAIAMPYTVGSLLTALI